MRHSRLPRVARGLAAASVATFAALVSHVSGGGDVPGWVGILVPWALSVVICLALTGRTLSVWRLSIAVVVSQVLFHVLFVLGTFTSSTAVVTGHIHGDHAAMLPGATGPALHGDATMWAWHAFAAVVTITALLHGERSVRAIAAFVAPFIAWLLPRFAQMLVRTPRPRMLRIGEVFPLTPLQIYFRDALPRRGPPSTLSV